MLADIQKKVRAAKAGGLIVISCSDPRVTVHEYLGLKRGEAALILNAGGRAAEAMATINTLDTIVDVSAIMIVHHTGTLSAPAFCFDAPSPGSGLS
jgi:carbonic anhydrase